MGSGRSLRLGHEQEEQVVLDSGICIGWLIAGSRLIPAIAVSDDVGDFFLGFAAAIMSGVLINWRDRP
jgi:hypothetical protein